jgi:hypothetical protein
MIGDPFEWPDPASLPEEPQRLILHWTAGSHVSSPHEWLRYHILVEHDAGVPDDLSDDTTRLVGGVPLHRNMGNASGMPPAHRSPDTGYAAHTSKFNSYSIGLALCGMRGAVDRRPADGTIGVVDPGTHPITNLQIKALVALCVQFCALWGYTPTEDRIFTHWEAEALHRRPQDGKWDITWVPGKFFTRRDVGPWIRRQANNWREGRPIDL